MNIDYEIVGKRIKEARLKKGLTQEGLSEIIDVSIAYLSRIERGNSQINLKRLVEICEILDMSLSEVLVGVVPSRKEYLNLELYQVLLKCTPAKQKLIYGIAQMVASAKFV